MKADLLREESERGRQEEEEEGRRAQARKEKTRIWTERGTRERQRE